MFLLRLRRGVLLASAACLVGGCGGEPNPGVVARMDFSEGAGFFDTPFPIDTRLRQDGSLRVGDFPNPHANALVDQLATLLEQSQDGFSLNGGIFVAFDGAIDASRLPADARASLAPESLVYLVDVTADEDGYGERIPIEVAFKREAETLSPANLLVALPRQGVVLTPGHHYALVVRRGLADEQGRPLFAPEALQDIFADLAPRGADGQRALSVFAPLKRWLGDAGVSSSDVAAATLFTAGDPLTQLTSLRDQLAQQPAPTATGAQLIDDFDDYCVISLATSLPVFQRGPKPYESFGSGQLVVDDAGRLVEQERDAIELVVTVPHRPMPAEGYPLVLYAAGAEGKARQVVDRTAIDADPDAGLGPRGEGPAKIYAARGVAALGFVAPLTWERNPAGTGGLLDFWNVGNLGAFRDNIRQGILDFTTLIAIAKTLRFDASLCPAASSPDGFIHYDPSKLVIHGHSTGSTIGSAVIALEPEPLAAVLSGAGGSWIYNVVLAEAPLEMKTIASLLLGLEAPDQVDLFDPAVTLFQTALESIEVMDWGRATVQHPLPGRSSKQVLLIEGVVDSYHFPRMVDAYGMSVGLDLVEPLADADAAADYELVGRGVLSPPAASNAVGPSGAVTAVTIQREQNHQDGHYVSFELDDVKYRYGCFVNSLVRFGAGVAVAPQSDALAPCP